MVDSAHSVSSQEKEKDWLGRMISCTLLAVGQTEVEVGDVE